MTNLVAKLPTDMTAWQSQFADSAGSDIDSGHDSTHFNVTTATHVYAFEGENLGYQTVGSHTRLTNAGDLHQLAVKQLFSGHPFTSFTMEFDTDAFILSNNFFNGDWGSIQNFLFSGDDTLKGSKYNDHLLGLGGNDTFDMTLPGVDTVEGGTGNDFFDFGATWSTADFVDGGDGTDQLSIGGNDYSVLLDNSIMTGIEILVLGEGHNYSIDLDQSAVPDGGMTVDATSLGPGNALLFSAAGVTRDLIVAGGAGDDSIIGGQGNDELVGREGNDTIDISLGGFDIANGDEGNDTIICGAELGLLPTMIDGGEGVDTVILDSNESVGGAALGAPLLANVEVLELHGSGHFLLGLEDSAIGGPGITVDGRDVQDSPGNNSLDVFLTDFSSTKTLTGFGGNGEDIFNGAAGNDDLRGNANRDDLVGHDGDDTLYGGKGNDIMVGLGGADTMNGGAGADEFEYDDASDSTGIAHDTIKGFDAAQDLISEGFAKGTNGVDPVVNGGTLSEASFDADLHAAMQGNLHSRKALIFKPDDGDFAGDTFLVIDANHKAGYQTGEDIVILLENANHLGQLDADNFI